MSDIVPLPITPRQQRLIEARQAVRRATQHVERFPAASATDTVKELKTALLALIAELESIT